MIKESCGLIEEEYIYLNHVKVYAIRDKNTFFPMNSINISFRFTSNVAIPPSDQPTSPLRSLDMTRHDWAPVLKIKILLVPVN